MAELPALIEDLALILVVAGIVTLIFKRLKQPLVLGYIVAGFLVSPNMPYTASVIDSENVHLWADTPPLLFPSIFPSIRVFFNDSFSFIYSLDQ